MSYRSQLPLADLLQLDSDRICNLILHSDLPWIDIELRINEMREVCLEREPEKVGLFEAIYVSRFQRLWDQWREQPEHEWEWHWDEDDAGEGDLCV